MSFSFSMFEKLIAGSRKPGGWFKGKAPSAAASLGDGASLIGLPADTRAPHAATMPHQPATVVLPEAQQP